MFEVVISTVNTGRVQRKSFATYEEAEQFVARHWENLGRRKRPVPASNYRVEVLHKERPKAQPAGPSAEAA